MHLKISYERFIMNIIHVHFFSLDLFLLFKVQLFNSSYNWTQLIGFGLVFTFIIERLEQLRVSIRVHGTPTSRSDFLFDTNRGKFDSLSPKTQLATLTMKMREKILFWVTVALDKFESSFGSWLTFETVGGRHSDTKSQIL